MAGIGKLGMNFWEKELQNMLGIQSGALQPQQLPQFQGIYQAIMNMGKQQDAQLYKEAMARGISGGALANLMRQSQEQRNNGILKTIQDMFSQSYQRGAGAANVGLDWKKFMEQLAIQQYNARTARQGQHLSNKWNSINAITSGITGLAKTGAGALAGVPVPPDGGQGTGSFSGGGGGGMSYPGATTGYGSRGGLNNQEAPWLNYDWSTMGYSK